MLCFYFMKNYILLLSFFSSFCEGQNLVINPSMEDTIPCPQWSPIGSKLPCLPWFKASSGTSDYFSSVYDSSCNVTDVPYNGLFGFQYPKTGNAMCGFGVFILGIPDYREYIEDILQIPLIVNHKYCVTFFVSLANSSRYSTDDIGLYFSVDSLYDSNTNQNLPVIPQIENPQGNIISDTLGWTLIQGEYIAAGGEKYITIGNFKNDANTTLDSIQATTYYFSYYFIDDVSVWDCTVGVEEIKTNEIKFTLQPNPANEKIILSIKNSKDKIQRIEIINCIGETLLPNNYFDYNKDQIEINIASLSKGLYFLKLKTINGFAVKKFVKE